MIIDGAVTTDTYTEHGIGRADVASLAGSVTWDFLEEPSTVAADAPGDVTLTLRDGGTVRGHVDRSPGGGSAPLGRDAVVAKFAGNVGDLAADLVEAVEGLADQPDLRPLLRLAAEAVPAPSRTRSTPTEAAR